MQRKAVVIGAAIAFGAVFFLMAFGPYMLVGISPQDAIAMFNRTPPG